MKAKVIFIKIFFTGFFILTNYIMIAQTEPAFHEFPGLPNTEGMAGMFAGQSGGKLFCMGGANFPDKKPWEGGKKVWYDEIYMLTDENKWVKLDQKLPGRLAYGIAVEYKDEIIVVGGNDESNFHKRVMGLRWNGSAFSFREYPSLPIPLASMAGALVNGLIIVAGGNSGFQDPPLLCCYALDLSNPDAGWAALPAWPGPARAQAVGGSYNGSFFLFSGEASGVETGGVKSRKILMDAYRLIPDKKNGTWTGIWEILPGMPKGASASANPVPVLDNGKFLFWGGVDAEATIQKDPKQHQGIGKRVFTYEAVTKTWIYNGVEEKFGSRVTLPSVLWKDQWLYISGEIKPGIRTPTIVSIHK
jgi:N-acetylneuraminic acid mutarotase